MKCPYCGNESHGKDVCGRCGEKIEIPGQGIEVEYKEFKISEFMEIRKKRRGSGPKGAPKAATEGIGKKEKDYKTAGVALSSAGNTGITAQHVPPGAGGRKRKLFIAVLALLVFAVITGVYYLLEFLFH